MQIVHCNTSFLSGNDLVLVRILCFLDNGEESDVAMRGISPLTKLSS